MIKSQFLSISVLQFLLSKAMSSEPWGQKTFSRIPLLKKEMKGEENNDEDRDVKGNVRQ